MLVHLILQAGSGDRIRTGHPVEHDAIAIRPNKSGLGDLLTLLVERDAAVVAGNQCTAPRTLNASIIYYVSVVQLSAS